MYPSKCEYCGNIYTGLKMHQNACKDKKKYVKNIFMKQQQDHQRNIEQITNEYITKLENITSPPPPINNYKYTYNYNIHNTRIIHNYATNTDLYKSLNNIENSIIYYINKNKHLLCSVNKVVEFIEHLVDNIRANTDDEFVKLLKNEEYALDICDSPKEYDNQIVEYINDRCSKLELNIIPLLTHYLNNEDKLEINKLEKKHGLFNLKLLK